MVLLSQARQFAGETNRSQSELTNRSVCNSKLLRKYDEKKALRPVVFLVGLVLEQKERRGKCVRVGEARLLDSARRT